MNTNEKHKQVAVPEPRTEKSTLKALGGSLEDEFNNEIVDQAINSLWMPSSDEEQSNRQMMAAIAALAGIKPRDELEGMLAAQIIGVHNSTMECLRRSMDPRQTDGIRRANLALANKLGRTFTAQMEALQRYRGKGQQKMTVEHVHVHDGGQAIVGTVNHPKGGKGVAEKSKG